MQLGRLFEMVYLLMEGGNLTAGQLARRFEVSERTIYRDVETLSQAGVPVYAVKGKGGGIRLLPDFVLDRSLLSQKEQSEILFALQSLSITGAGEEGQVLSRLSALFHREEADWIGVDFSRWGSGDAERERFLRLKEGILTHRVVQFLYHSSAGTTGERRVEPVQLRFKNYDWYLAGYCLDRQEFRTFKISRMARVTVTELPAEHRAPPPPIDPPANPKGQEGVAWVRLVLGFSPKAAFRVYDEFSGEQITPAEDGSLIVVTEYEQEGDWMLSHLLSYGADVQVLSPPQVRERLREKLLATLKLYETP